MSESRLRDYLDQIESAAVDAISFVEGFDEAAFLESKVVQQATVMSLLIIGEAATKILEKFPEFTSQHETVPWRSMRGMRNRIAHGYFEIDHRVVWVTVNSTLPELLTQIRAINR